METQLSEDVSHNSTHLGHENQPAVMWSVRRVCGSSRVCPILPIMDLHDQNEPGHQLKSYFRPDLEIKSL